MNHIRLNQTFGDLGRLPADGCTLVQRVSRTGRAERLDDVLKTTVFMVDLADFGKVNAIYAEFFGPNYPARSCVQVAALPAGGLVEIEAVANKAADTIGKLDPLIVGRAHVVYERGERAAGAIL